MSPGFPVETRGFDDLHAALFTESSTRGRHQQREVGNPGVAATWRRNGSRQRGSGESRSSGPLASWAGSDLRSRRGRVAGGGRGSDQVGQRRLLSVRRLAVYGCRRLYRALDLPYPAQRNQLRLCRSICQEAPHCLGDPGRRALGSRKHTNCLRDSRCGSGHGFSPVEHQLTDRAALGRAAVPRASGSTGQKYRQGSLRRYLHRSRGNHAGLQHHPGCRRSGAARGQGSIGGGRRQPDVGNHVRALPQGLPERHESALVRYRVYGGRTGYDVPPHLDARWRHEILCVSVAPQQAVAFLAVPGRLRVGGRRPLSAVRHQVFRDRAWHSALEHKPALGSGLGGAGIWRAGLGEPGSSCPGRGRIGTHDHRGAVNQHCGGFVSRNNFA